MRAVSPGRWRLAHWSPHQAAGDVEVKWRVRGTADEVSIVSGTTTDDLEQSSSFAVPTSMFHAKLGVVASH